MVRPIKKTEKGIYETTNPENKTPFPTELDDLIRLHFCLGDNKNYKG